MNVLFKIALVNYLDAEDNASKAQLLTQMGQMLSALTVLDLDDAPAIYSEDEESTDDVHPIERLLYSNAIAVIVQLLQTNDSIRHLIFRGNMIDDIGAFALLEMLTQRPFPVFVDLRRNEVSTDAMQQLFELYQTKASQYPELINGNVGAYSSFSQFLSEDDTADLEEIILDDEIENDAGSMNRLSHGG